MKADLRESGIEFIGEVPWGTHFCQFYQSKEDLLEILVPYFKQGLENNEFCMWVTSEPLGAEDAKAALKEKVKNLDEYIKKGQIEILDYSQWYTKTGRFDADKVLEGWVEKEKQAIERGFDGLRLTGNTFWLEKKDWENFTDYEAVVNSVIKKHRMLAVCSYSLDKCQASEIVDVVSNHQFALIKKEGKWVSLESSERKQAEGVLKAPEEKYRSLVQNIPDVVWTTEINGKTIFISPNVKEIYGYTSEEIYKGGDSAWFDRIHPDDVEKVKGAFISLFEKGELFDVEYRIQRKDKDWIWLHDRATNVYEKNGIKYANGVFSDITERKRVEEVLQKSVRLLEDTGEMAKVGGWELDLSTQEVSWTEEVGRIHGVEPGYKPKLEEALNFYPPESRPDVEAAVKKAAETGEPYDLESLFIPSGSKDKIWVRSLGRAVYSGGKIVKLAGTFQNIDKYKRAEEALQESEAIFRVIFDHANDGIILADEETKNFYIGNNIICQMLGYSLEEIKKLGVADIHPREDLPYVIEQFQRQVRREIAVAKDLPVKRKDGGVFYADVNTSLVTLAGKTYLLGIFRDITERKRIEEALRESQKKYMDLFENANDSIYTMDLTGKLVSFNHTAAEMLGYSEEEFSRLNMKDCYASAVQSIQKAVTEKSDLKELQPWEFKMIKKDETIIDTEVRTRLIWEKGQIIGIHGIARNITERNRTDEELRAAYKKLKQTQQELIQSSKMAAMGQLAAGISHELNQPLTGIKGFAQAVLMDLEKESPLRDDLNKIVGQADRMDTIIKNVRFFARKSDFNIVELDINKVVSDSLMLLNQQLKVHNIRVIQELGLGIPNMQGDPNQLQQAFLNIISNARDAILSLNRPEGGEIRICTLLSQDRNHIEITFQDTGCGIPEGNCQHIFSLFYTTKSPDRGMGLGLSIAYRIIVNHQGKIEFKSKEGQGTTFNIVFPLQGTKHKIKQS